MDVGGSDDVDGPIGAVGAEEADVHLWLAWDLDERPSESEHVLFGATWGGTVGSDEDGRSLLSHVGDLNPKVFQRCPGYSEALDDIVIAESLTVTSEVERGVLGVAVEVDGEDQLVVVHWQRKVEKLIIN